MGSSKSIIVTLRQRLSFHLICKYYLKTLSNFIHYLYRYDFDRDGYISKEDVRLILSHIPICNTVTKTPISEGKFTREGGGNQVFIDRI